MNDQLIISTSKFKETKRYYIHKEGNKWKLLEPFQSKDGPYFTYTKKGSNIHISGQITIHSSLEDVYEVVEDSYISNQYPKYIDDNLNIYYQDKDEILFGKQNLSNESAAYVYILCQSLLTKIRLFRKGMKISYEQLLTHENQEMLTFKEFKALSYIEEFDPAIKAKFNLEGCYMDIKFSKSREFLSLILPSLFE